jgi:hypothetical protein
VGVAQGSLPRATCLCTISPSTQLTTTQLTIRPLTPWTLQPPSIIPPCNLQSPPPPASCLCRFPRIHHGSSQAQLRLLQDPECCGQSLSFQVLGGHLETLDPLCSAVGNEMGQELQKMAPWFPRSST